MTDPAQPRLSVAALYRFTSIADPAALRDRLTRVGAERGLCGTLLIAGEGLNGTVAGEPDAVEALLAELRALPGCETLAVRRSQADTAPFGRWKVRLKAEIVTMGQATIDAARDAGTYVEPADWDALIADPGMVVIDTRNGFEVEIGQFPGAIDPGIARFRDFPAWFDAMAPAWHAAGKRIAMYCTGGIRCEKATAYARSRGFNQVYHLRGGILAYLETVPAERSRYAGACFVFDERGALGQDLAITKIND